MILLVTDDFPPAVGGVATYLHSIYQGEDVTVVAPGSSRLPVPGGHGDAVAEGTASATGNRQPATFRLARWVSAFFTAASTLRRVRPDFIHAGTLLPSGLIALVLSVVFRVPYAIHVYGTDLTTTRRSRLMQRLALMALRRAERVIVISDFGAHRAAVLGVDRARITKIVPPVDARRFTPAPSAPSPRRTLLTVARLVPRKGIDTVLRALALVLPEMPDVRYVIAGDGPDRARLETLVAELRIGHAVHFTGAVDDVLPWYRACDVFVMVSRTIAAEGEVEGFGIAFAEASACGKPVIGGRSGGVAEAVIDGVTGVLVPPEDPVALARTIADLLGDPERCRRLGEQGREWVLQNLDPEAARAQLRAPGATPSILYPTELAMLQGGSQISLLTLLATRDRAFYRRIVVCPPGDDEYVAQLERLGVRAYVAGTYPHNWRFSPRRPLGTLRDIISAARATASIVRRENVRLIHVHSVIAGLAAVYAKRRHPSLRLVLHERSLMYRAYTRVLLRFVSRRMDRVIATTGTGRRELIAYGVDAAKIVVIPNGTDFTAHEPSSDPAEVRRALGIPPSARVIGLVANWVRVKRHELFADVIARLLQDGEDVYGVIVGGVMPILDGAPYEREVHAHIDALGIGQRILFTGPRDDVPDLMRAMDVLVCTSSHESFGRILIEAMAVGTPVVSTNAGAIPDVVSDGRTGLLASGTPEALAAAVRRLLHDPELVTRLTKAASEDVRQRFDAAAVTRRIETVYRELLGP